MLVKRRYPLPILALLLVTSPALRAQRTAAPQNATRTANVDWDALIPKIKNVLSDAVGCDEAMSVGDDSNVTGDGTPLALVECAMGAYMDSMTFLTLEKGEPIMARFRDGHGKPLGQNFIDGASVMHGAATITLPAEHAIVQLYWNSPKDDEEPTIADCGGTAYIWNQRSKTFDIDPKQVPNLVERECHRQFQRQ